MKTKPQTFSAALARLAAIRAELHKPCPQFPAGSKETLAQEADTTRLCKKEDDAMLAIANLPASNIAELLMKIRIMFEDADGIWLFKGMRPMTAFRRMIEADAARLAGESPPQRNSRKVVATDLHKAA